MSAFGGLAIVRTEARVATTAEDWSCWAGRRELGCNLSQGYLVLRKLQAFGRREAAWVYYSLFLESDQTASATHALVSRNWSENGLKES
jgi:hypothetical protein